MTTRKHYFLILGLLLVTGTSPSFTSVFFFTNSMSMSPLNSENLSEIVSMKSTILDPIPRCRGRFCPGT